jgi:hypothetical protein
MLDFRSKNEANQHVLTTSRGATRDLSKENNMYAGKKNFLRARAYHEA